MAGYGLMISIRDLEAGLVSQWQFYSLHRASFSVMLVHCGTSHQHHWQKPLTMQRVWFAYPVHLPIGDLSLPLTNTYAEFSQRGCRASGVRL